DEHVYAVGEKGGSFDKRGWKLGGYSLSMWNSDTFGYDGSTDPIYVSVPFYMVMRHGVAFGVFLDNTFRSNFDIGHQSEGVLSFGAEDRKSTRLNSSHQIISYAVFCLKKKRTKKQIYI